MKTGDVLLVEKELLLGMGHRGSIRGGIIFTVIMGFRWRRTLELDYEKRVKGSFFFQGIWVFLVFFRGGRGVALQCAPVEILLR